MINGCCNKRLALDSAAIFRFHYNTQMIQTLSQCLHIPTSAFRPLKYNCSYHNNHINSRAANTHLLKTLYNGKSSSFIMCSQLYPKHYVSFSLTDYPIAKDCQTRPQNPQPNVPTENVEVNPIYEYFLLFYSTNKEA